MRAAETGSPQWVIKLTRRLAVACTSVCIWGIGLLFSRVRCRNLMTFVARVRFPFLTGSELTLGSNSWCNASRDTGYLDFFWPWAEPGWQPDALLAFQFSVACLT